MKIVIVGTDGPTDYTTSTGIVLHDWRGSMQASASALLPFVAEDDDLCVVGRMPANLMAPYKEYMKARYEDRISTRYVIPGPEARAPGRMTQGGERWVGNLGGCANALRFEELPHGLFDGCRAVLFNAGGPYTYEPRMIEQVRQACPGVFIQVDPHCLLWHLDEEFNIVYGPLTNWAYYMGMADVVQCNRAEAQILLQRHPSERLEAEELLLGLHAAGLPCPVVTDAAEGACVLQYDGFSQRPIAERIPAPEITQIIDETGCGDAFGGAFLSGKLRGYGNMACGQLGCACGTLACQYLGYPRPGDITKKSIEYVMRTTYARDYSDSFFALR